MQWIPVIPLDRAVLANLVASLVIILALWLVRLLLLRLATNRLEDSAARYQWRKISSYAAVALAVLLIGPMWISGFSNTATYLGLLSAGIAIALQPLIVNLIGWMFILWRRPFRVGDRIQIGDYAGDVIDARLFQFLLMEIGNWVGADQHTGRIINVPNGKVFTDALANYSRGFQYIWNEIPVLVTFESDWEQAKQLLHAIVDAHAAELSKAAQRRLQAVSRQFLIPESSFEPTVYTSVEDSGVLLTLRYLCDPRRRRDSEQEVWEAILRAFAPHATIDFAYPTQREFFHAREGKQAVMLPDSDAQQFDD